MNEMADRPLRVADEVVVVHWWRMLRWFANLRLIPRWSEHTAKSLTRVYRRLYYDGLTRIGKIVLICSLFIFLFSYRVNSDFLLMTSAAGLAMLLWSLVLGFIYKPRVSVQRDTPKTAIAGQALVLQISVTNESKRGLYNFTIRELIVPDGRWPREWLRPHQMALAPGQNSTVEVGFEPQKRGVLSLSGLAVQSYVPFFLTRFTFRAKESTEVYVLPSTLQVSVPSLRHIAEQASKRLTQGSDNAAKGASLEYAFSRHYQIGDSLRRLDHRASSRRGEPMSKVFEGADEIRRDKVYLIVDLTLQDFELWERRPRNEDILDKRLALAVEIGLSAQNEGFSLAALATGRQWHTLENLLEFYQHIASCKPERAMEYEGNAGKASLPDTVLSDSGLHILVIGRWGAETQAQVDRWQRDGILVLVFLLAESSSEIGALPAGSQFVEVRINEEQG